MHRAHTIDKKNFLINPRFNFFLSHWQIESEYLFIVEPWIYCADIHLHVHYIKQGRCFKEGDGVALRLLLFQNRKFTFWNLKNYKEHNIKKN